MDKKFITFGTTENPAALKFPADYTYLILDFKQENDENISCKFRIKGIFSKESVVIWLRKFENVSGVQWRVARTFSTRPKFNLFQADYKCQHNTDQRSRIRKKRIIKHTGCTASLKVVVQRYFDVDGQPEIPAVTKEFPCYCVLINSHNHSVDTGATLRFRPLKPETKNKLLQLFQHGHGATSARKALDTALHIEHAEEYEKLSADASLLPSVSTVYHLFNRFKTTHGAHDTSDMYDQLEEFILDYNGSGEGKASITKVNTHIAVALCTPIMQRAALLLPHIKEIVLVDASRHVGQLNHCIYFFASPAILGGAPIGCIITDVEKEEVFTAGIHLLRNCIPAASDLVSIGPMIFMTDGNQKERQALESVWPNSIYLLCQFHVLKALWHWLCNKNNDIEPSNRLELFFAVKSIMYAKNIDIFNDKVKKLCFKGSQKFEKYFHNLLRKKTLWASCFRNGLPVRENPNTYTEVLFRILKDTVFDRVKMYTIIQLLHFITTNYEKHLHRKYLDFHGRYIKSLLKNISPELKEYEISVDGRAFKVKDSNNVYYVNKETAFCMCLKGSTGHLCCHISGVALKYGMYNLHIYSTAHQEIMFQIATGKQDSKCLKSLSCNSSELQKIPEINEITSDESLCSSSEAQDASAIVVYTDDSSCTLDTQNIEVAMEREKKTIDFSKFDSFVERIKKKVTENPIVFEPALNKMLENAKKFASTETALVSAMYNFAKNSRSYPLLQKRF